MNKYVTSILIFGGVFLMGLLLVLGLKNVDVTINVNEKAQNQDATTVNDTKPTVADEIQKPILKESEFAQLSGKICYPSEMIPPLTLYLINLNSDQTITKQTSQNQSNYLFEELAPGSYQIYAKVTSQANNPDSLIGGFTPAVECGLTVECTNHELIEINLESDVNFDTADICDWYGVEL